LEEAAAGEPVLFIGHVGDIAPYYAIADVMALPSLTEGSPNVLLEAMACGVPSVSTAVGGVPEIVAHEESALLVKPRAPQELADALERVLAHPDLAQKLSARAADLIQERHVPEVRVRALVAVYTSMLNRGGHTAT
jgi:glycosyltransferase involved in cell wall biosynthesis